MSKQISKPDKKAGHSNQRPKTYTGVIEHPQTREISGRVYFRENDSSSSLKYGTILLIAALAALAATLSPVGNALADGLGLSGIEASGVWIILIAIAGTAGFIMAIIDWSTRGSFNIVFRLIEGGVLLSTEEESVCWRAAGSRAYRLDPAAYLRSVTDFLNCSFNNGIAEPLGLELTDDFIVEGYRYSCTNNPYMGFHLSAIMESVTLTPKEVENFRKFRNNFELFNRKYEEFKTHIGEYVAISDGKVMGFGSTDKEMRQKYGAIEGVFIDLITADNILWIL